jgi:hypothetical protein
MGRQREHVERETAGHPAVVVAGQRDRRALAHQLDDGSRLVAAETDNVA